MSLRVVIRGGTRSIAWFGLVSFGLVFVSFWSESWFPDTLCKIWTLNVLQLHTPLMALAGMQQYAKILLDSATMRTVISVVML